MTWQSLGDEQRATLLRAFGGKMTAEQINAVVLVADLQREDALCSEGAGLGRWDRETNMPWHLPIAVDEEGCGPVPDDEAHHWACWCWEKDCALTAALRKAGEAGERRART